LPERLENPLPGLLFSLLVLLLAAAAWWLNTAFPGAYFQLVQEDGPLEWATFWAFVLASLVWLRVWFKHRTGSGWLTFYLLGLSCGCLLLAMEEISWGQRLFAYQPPETFLVANYQQEVNLHNLADTRLRKAALMLLLVGYGVMFPLFARLPFFRSWLQKIGLIGHAVAVPAVASVPGFAAAAAVYAWYPWYNTGEWVELFAGFGFLCCAGAAWPTVAGGLSRAGALVVVTLVAGAATPWLVPTLDTADRVLQAQRETHALAADFQRKRLRSRCGVHMRVYSFVEAYGARRMAESGFGADLVSDTDLQRKQHFLDPWHLPYWIRHHCRDGESVAFVYSFGPDRRRQSTSSGTAGDDIGAVVAGAKPLTSR